jgi:ubiquinone/menaquinone biosynthesis C-methylase UbiE
MLKDLLWDPQTHDSLAWTADAVTTAKDGRNVAAVRNGIPRFVDDGMQDSFGLQWNKFAKVQLDSVNGTTQSKDRLLEQSGLKPEDFAGKTILEVGCGAGRFTEIMLSFGAELVSLDYSTAVDANMKNHKAAFDDGRVVFVQGNVFELPVKDESFDIVFCYGVLQHTGDPRRALESLWTKVKPGGTLLVDRYGITMQYLKPFQYLFRPITKRVPAPTLLKACEAYVNAVYPAQVRFFGAIQGNGVKKIVRLVANRLQLNSVFPINLHVQGKLPEEIAIEWSVLDTFDMWSPRFDLPVTFNAWKKQTSELPRARLDRCIRCGQGVAATVHKMS